LRRIFRARLEVLEVQRILIVDEVAPVETRHLVAIAVALAARHERTDRRKAADAARVAADERIVVLVERFAT